MSSLHAFMNGTSDGVFVIGHASALLRINKKLILFDPAWGYQPFSGYWKLCPEQFNCDDIIEKIDACVISHIHDDHYNEDILKKLKCPIYIMSGRPEFEAKISQFTKQIYPIKAKETFQILDGINIKFLPSSFNPVDSSCFAWTMNYGFYHGNDNFVSLKDVDETMSEIVRIDVACVPYAYLNWYPECMEDYTVEQKKSETERLVKKMADFGIQLIRTLNPKIAIPAGANLYYCDDVNSPMNKMGISPWEFRRRCPVEMRYNVVCLTAGDYTIANQIIQKRDETSYLEEIGEMLKDSHPKNLTAEIIPQPYYITAIQKKLQKARHMVAGNIVVFPVGDWNLLISLETLQCCYTKMIPDHSNKTIITIEPYQLKEWLEGRLTYEMVVATRKFKMKRIPDEYNVKVFEFILNYL